MDLPNDFKEVLDSVTKKRARFVIDTILRKGYCSTEDLKNGGYEHAPRAARDVRELGIPLDTFKIKDSSGKNIAAYKFGNWEIAKRTNQLAKVAGRTQLTEKLKNALIQRYGARCNLYGEEYPVRLLQPDHRIPYEIGGDPTDMFDTDMFMLLSPSANRDKSWAGEKEKKLNIVFNNEDMELYNQIVEQAELHNISYQSVVKRMIEYYQYINGKPDK